MTFVYLAVKDRIVSSLRSGGGSMAGCASSTWRPSGVRCMNTGITGAPVWADMKANPGEVEAGRPKKSTNTPWEAGRFWSSMNPTSSFLRRAFTHAR